MLTPKQEKFCQCIVSGMSGKDAYVAAYDHHGGDRTAYNEANILLKRNDITKRIKVDMTKKNKEEKEIDGVKTTITTGKVEITDNENSVYKYQLIKVTDSNKDFETLIENMNKATNMFEKLKAYKHFYNRYYELVPSPRDLAWQEVKNMTIPQPETSENGDKYILWLMQDGDIIDLQILTCTRAEDGGEEIETVIVKETSKLPFTYDSMILFMVLGVLIVLTIFE